MDCTITAIVVNATRTGSFMDGFATPTNCKIDGGNPRQATQHEHTFDVFVHPDYDQQFLFSNMVDFPEKIMSYSRELAN